MGAACSMSFTFDPQYSGTYSFWAKSGQYLASIFTKFSQNANHLKDVGFSFFKGIQVSSFDGLTAHN